MSKPSPSEPEILAFIEEVARFYPPGSIGGGIEVQRARYDALCQNFDAPLPSGLSVSDESAPHPDGPVPLRRYRSATVKHEALVVYFHGGGFVVGGLDSHHAICAEIAEATGAEVVATGYRLAPEHRFPLALTDCLAAVLVQGSRPVVVAGDSAGGSLAAGLAMTLRDAARKVPAALELLQAAGWREGTPLPRLAGQALIYPVTGGDLSAGSYLEMAEAPCLTTEEVRYYRDILGAPEGDPYGHPLAAADWTDLPPAYITSAFFDPLRDDGRNSAARLAAAGIDVTYREEPQMVHAWLRARHRSPSAKAGFDALCRGIGELLDNGEATKR
ncbi:alpha/beta hydrolase [Pelagibius marinus]|uniref:alpha/beta hydrolase n=1 Tax=Pelagibius marinus TaxID=2762760 RepID=UPI0018727214|nr:alpha/beta hydrolase [Pelagibius marinus]